MNSDYYTKNNMHKHNKGFTLVELLIVIVVIAILAAVTVVAYNGLVGRAQDSMAQSGLSTAKKELTLYYQENGSYPLANECPNPSAGNICLSQQPGTTFVYTPNNSTDPPTYTLVARTGNKAYSASSSSPPTNGVGGGAPVEVENIIRNGGFNNTASWAYNTQSPSTTVISGGKMTVNDVPGGRVSMPQYITWHLPTDQDKMYFSIRVKRLGGLGFTSTAYRHFGGYGQNIVTAAQFNSLPIGGPLTRFSTVRIFHLSQGVDTSMRIGTNTAADEYAAEIDDVIVINLTKDFGAGKEPTAAQMDDIILQQVPGQFFQDKITVYK